MEDLAPEDLVDEWSDLSASSLAAGARLGRYELLLPIAWGGMARVWAARLHGQRGFSKTVAIKTILPNLAHNPEFERMFLDEARIAAAVHHPNVTEIYELGEEGQVLYLAMEWVNGDSLQHVLRAGSKTHVPIEPRIAARIIADACAGLHAAHELTDDDRRLLNVVHRDVSPHNILVSLEGTVKVTDFGVAKALGQSHQATSAGQIKGKVAYMAPEQIGGTAFDRRADIFGMGCVLYESVTGLQPFRGTNDPQVMQAVLKGEYEPPSTTVKGFPPELAAIIDRALANEPRARFATAERMRVALEEWLAKSGSVVTATQTGSLVRQRLGPALERRRELVKAAMASLQPESAPPRSGSGSGNTPSPSSKSGQSHSGVVPMQGSAPPASASDPMLPRASAASAPSEPMRQRTPSIPNGPPPVSRQPPPPPCMRAEIETVKTTQKAAMQPPSNARYVAAAAAGVAFAIAAGGVSLALWMHTHADVGAPAVVAPVAPVPVTPVRAATAATTVASPSSLPFANPTLAPVASASTAPADSDSVTQAPRAGAGGPVTINVSDLPPVKSVRAAAQVAPAPQPVAAPHPSAPPAPPALPANPY